MFGRKRSGGKTTEERSTVAHEIVASVQTDTGCVREINEDSGRLVRPADEKQLKKRGTLLIVADGMGGHSAGEVASGMAVELIPEIYYASKGEPSEALKEAVEEAGIALPSGKLDVTVHGVEAAPLPQVRDAAQGDGAASETRGQPPLTDSAARP